MEIKKVKSGLVLDEVRADEWVLGGVADDVVVTLGGVVNQSGNWLPWAVGESQKRNGLETMSCATYGTLNALEMLAAYQGKAKVSDFSERFTSTLAGTTRNGNSPHKVAEIARRKGLLPERVLPFDESITTWDAYYSGITEAMKRSGESFEKNWNISHRWIWRGTLAPGEQRNLLVAALQRSPVGVAVFGWASEMRSNSEGKKERVYIRPEGAAVQHWCVLVGCDDEGHWLVLDSYEDEQGSYIKKLDKNYQFEYPKGYSIERKINDNLFSKLLRWLFG